MKTNIVYIYFCEKRNIPNKKKIKKIILFLLKYNHCIRFELFVLFVKLVGKR